MFSASLLESGTPWWLCWCRRELENGQWAMGNGTDAWYYTRMTRFDSALYTSEFFASRPRFQKPMRWTMVFAQHGTDNHCPERR